MTIDMRARQVTKRVEAEAAIREILRTSTVPDISTEIERLADFPPMEKSVASGELAETAVAIAAQLGFEIADAETGGSSDANNTTAAGVPSLDGLGPIDGNDHTPREYIELSSIVPRTALLAALVLSVHG
jgi:glutamate carboxypeptidase